ncbi:hexapeptide transferase, partial [bacterium]|nr:hexapeptide transferase [bacterium]
SGLSLIIDSIFSVYKYNIGLIDYFYFRFYKLDDRIRSTYMGTGFKYEYDLIMNPISERSILQNKLEFFNAFHPFIKHGMCRLEDLKENNEYAKKVLQNSSGKVAVKDALGQCGWGVEILNLKDFTREELIQYVEAKGFNMIEEYIQQHDDLANLSDTGLNTIRIITQLNENDEVEYIGPTLRITVNSGVDNMAMGNIAAPIDPKTGEVYSVGVYQDITKGQEEVHPITKNVIKGFKVPFWNDVLELTKQAALYNKKNRSIGWDVAITNSGPSLLEGNHNWCKLLWQLPLQEGRKNDLQGYLDVYRLKRNFKA